MRTALCLLLLLTGCPVGERSENRGPPPPAGIDAERSTVTLSARRVRADGIHEVGIDVCFAFGEGAPGAVETTLTVSGTGNLLDQLSPSAIPSCMHGRLRSTVVERKHIGLSAKAAGTNAVAISVPDVEFVTGTATQLAFRAQPTSGAAAVNLQPLAVELRDAQGALANEDGFEVTLALGTQATATGALFGSPTTLDLGGVATFPRVRISAAGTYTLVATSPGLTPAESAPFTLGPPTAEATTALRFVTAPASSVSSGVPFTVQVGGSDELGVPTPLADNIGVELSTEFENPIYACSFRLSGTTTQFAEQGLATFTDLRIAGTPDPALRCRFTARPYCRRTPTPCPAWISSSSGSGNARGPLFFITTGEADGGR